MRLTCSVLCTLLLCFARPAIAQLTPAQAVAGMGRGVNLGNTLEPPTEGGWNNGPVQQSYFDAYVDAGFTNVRIPVRWDEHTGRSVPYAVNAAWMDRVEQVVDWALARNLYVTLNGHHEDWLKNAYSNPALRARYDSIWVQIIERFQGKSDRLLFEVINEPNGMSVAQVDDLNARILSMIRAAEPTRIVIFGGNAYSNSAELLRAQVPDDAYIIGYYHSYDPWNFAGLGEGTWGRPSDYQQVTAKVEAVKRWSDQKGVPVHLSEFGAVVNADYNSRMRWFAHTVQEVMRVGFAFSVWDDGGMFRILERGTLQWPEVKDILVHYYTDSPADITSALQVDPPTRDSSVLVSWRNRTTSTADLIIERARATGEAFTVVATLPAGSDRYVDTNLVGGGTFIYRLYTHRTDGTLLHGYPTKLFVPSGVQASFGAGPITLPGILEVELYDKGGEGLAYHDTDAINEGGSFRLEEGVDIGGGPGGALTLGYVVSGEWLEYTVDVQQAGNYIVTASTASEQANGAFRVSFEKNQAATTFTTPNTGNWNGYRNITANSLIKLDTGLQVMRLAITGTAPTNINWLRFDVQTSDLSESAASIGFLVGPNPAVDFVGITLPQNLLATRAQLSLVSMTGQVLRKLNVETQQQQLDVSALASGQYYLQLELDGTAYTQPVTVLR